MRCEVQAARHFDGLLLDKKAYEQATDTKSSAIPSLLEYCRGAKEEDEVNENKSITPLRKYIAIGYAVIALLIGGIVFIYMHEWRELEHIPNHKRLRILSATSDKHIVFFCGLFYSLENSFVFRKKWLSLLQIPE